MFFSKINSAALGLSSCFILLGSALLYANSGTTNMDGLCAPKGCDFGDGLLHLFIDDLIFIDLDLIDLMNTVSLATAYANNYADRYSRD